MACPAGSLAPGGRTPQDGLGHDRPRPVRAVVLPSDRQPGLASCDAHSEDQHIPARWPAECSRGQLFGHQARPKLEGSGCGVCQDTQATALLHVAGCWEPGYEEAWFLITDLTPETAESCWYGLRNWIEQGFKLIKSGGWQWQKTKMTDPQRVERLWLAIAVATMWVLRVGGQYEEQPHPTPEPAKLPGSTDRRERKLPQRPGRTAHRPSRSEPSRRVDRGDSSQDKPTHQSPDGRPAGHAPVKRRPSGTRARVVSVFRQGISHLLFLLTMGQGLPQGQWLPEPWPVIQPQMQRTHAQATHAVPENPP